VHEIGDSLKLKVIPVPYVVKKKPVVQEMTPQELPWKGCTLLVKGFPH